MPRRSGAFRAQPQEGTNPEMPTQIASLVGGPGSREPLDKNSSQQVQVLSSKLHMRQPSLAMEALSSLQWRVLIIQTFSWVSLDADGFPRGAPGFGSRFGVWGRAKILACPNAMRSWQKGRRTPSLKTPKGAQGIATNSSFLPSKTT